MPKLVRVDEHVLINRVVIVDMLNGKRYCLFQVCLDLTGQTKYRLQFIALMGPQHQKRILSTKTQDHNNKCMWKNK